MSDVTQLLGELQLGAPGAADRLAARVYEELRRLARARLARERPGQTLQATALVHEVWLRLVDADEQQRFANRAHFFGAAAEAMRRLLIDRARRRLAERHGGGREPLDVDEVEIAAPLGEPEKLLQVHEALHRLAAHDARKAELVKLRYFAGFTIEEAAEILDISVPTAKRDWTYARAWLFREVSRED